MRDAKNYTVVGVCIVMFIITVSFLYKEVFSVPADFPVGKNFTINENESLKSISVRLKEEKIISSPLLFRAGVSFLGKDRVIQLGGYVFPKPLSLYGLVGIFVKGRPDFPLLSVTVPEGSTSAEIAHIISQALPSVSVEDFLTATTKHDANGKLFPSTYFLLPSYTADTIVIMMLGTFVKKIATLSLPTKIPAPLNNQKEIIILASILEGEAKTQEDMKIVSGILLARLAKGMPLQVDVALETYKQKGLPSKPINNPGLIAIDAVLHPTTTPYLFYITGKDRQMYYAKTFEEHKKNIKKYLK